MMTNKENKTKLPTYDIFTSDIKSAEGKYQRIKIGVAWVTKDKLGVNCSIDVREYRNLYFEKRLRKKPLSSI